MIGRKESLAYTGGRQLQWNRQTARDKKLDRARRLSSHFRTALGPCVSIPLRTPTLTLRARQGRAMTRPFPWVFKLHVVVLVPRLTHRKAKLPSREPCESLHPTKRNR